jgi:hypothetical protein
MLLVMKTGDENRRIKPGKGNEEKLAWFSTWIPELFCVRKEV